MSDVFEAAFSILRKGNYRSEYVYRAALTKKILMGTHSLKTATVLNEFRVGESKADIAILNGTATVYEIKSERDSLIRLEKQIESYRKVFPKVFVIAGGNHVDAILSLELPDVGVLRLSQRHQISTLRDATVCYAHICPIAIFESIRANEAKLILEQIGTPVPDVPNTALHFELRKLFEALSPEQAHLGMVRALKKTRNSMTLSNLVDKLPPSLRAAALSIPLRKADHERLIQAVNTNFIEAMKWK
ncbi:sce7726 family protein [Azospirillum endophyticum]